MSIIKSHDITLYGGNDEYNIVLRPLTDEYLPYLYKWNADPEVVYWADSGNVEEFNEDDIRGMYGNISQNALCFLVEANGKPIGDFWLQKMNIPEVSAKFPGLDVRRIEATIGEKAYWGHGIGTAVLGMLIDFAFCEKAVDILYCFAADYNIRSRKTLVKHGFQIYGEEDVSSGSLRAKKEYHYRLTRQEYINLRRYRPAEDKIFFLPILSLQPSQLYISDGKLRNVREWFDPSDISNFDPIPIKEFYGRKLMTDGHTRAVAAYLAGWESIPVYIDPDELDMDVYALDVKWCEEAGIHSPIDLVSRIVSHKDYERLWRRRNCDEYYK